MRCGTGSGCEPVAPLKGISGGNAFGSAAGICLDGTDGAALLAEKPVSDGPFSQVFELTGRLGGEEFPAWMDRHARKLGVAFRAERRRADLLRVEATGAAEMVEAFALACSLGPKSVCIDGLAFPDPGHDQPPSQSLGGPPQL